MNIIFIRHGQGEHTLNSPESLQIVDPCLTEKGKGQSKRLSERFLLTVDDMIIISPTRRTIQTAKHWDHQWKSQHIIHNAVGSRMFPLLPASRALLCDTHYPKRIYSPNSFISPSLSPYSLPGM